MKLFAIIFGAILAAAAVIAGVQSHYAKIAEQDAADVERLVSIAESFNRSTDLLCMRDGMDDNGLDFMFEDYKISYLQEIIVIAQKHRIKGAAAQKAYSDSRKAASLFKFTVEGRYPKRAEWLKKFSETEGKIPFLP